MGKNQKKISAKDLSQDVFNLFDEYVHTGMNRRDFMAQLSKYATAGLTATAIADFLLQGISLHISKEYYIDSF